MAVYKEEKTNTWRVIYRYTDWTGEKKQTQKRGFKTKRDAQAWEREQLHKVSADLDMTFASFFEQYTADMQTRIKENTWATKELSEYKSVRGKLRTADLEQENDRLRSRLRTYEEVISRNNLWSYFSRNRGKTATRDENR